MMVVILRDVGTVIQPSSHHHRHHDCTSTHPVSVRRAAQYRRAGIPRQQATIRLPAILELEREAQLAVGLVLGQLVALQMVV